MKTEKTNDWIDETVATLPPLLTTDDVATTLRVCRRTVARLLAEGRLASVRHGEAGGARRLIARSEIGKYLRSLEAA